MPRRINIAEGDLTTFEVDAIVNAANNSLLGGGGVDGAIHRAAGRQLLEECRTLGGCPTGEAKITGGYNLPAKHVIHQASMRLGGGTAAEGLRSSTAAVLALADENDIRTLAFPATGTGIAGFGMRQCAEIMLAEVRKHVSAGTKLTDVYFVLFDPPAVETFRKAYEETQP